MTLYPEKKQHADEVDIDSSLVGRLIVSQFPEWAELTVATVPFRGTDNALYRLGSNMVVRLPRRQKNAEQLKKELHWLPKLAPRLPLPVPVPLATGKPAEGYPFHWAIYRWLEGESAAGDKLDRDRRRPTWQHLLLLCNEWIPRVGRRRVSKTPGAASRLSCETRRCAQPSPRWAPPSTRRLSPQSGRPL